MKLRITPELDELIVLLNNNEAFRKLLALLRADVEHRAVRFVEFAEAHDWERGIVCGELRLINLLSDRESAFQRMRTREIERDR